MQRHEFADLTFRANGAFGVQITCDYLDPRFDLIANPNVMAGDSGLIWLFQIVRKEIDAARFCARWDQADNRIDVDRVLLNGCHRKDGFVGHRSSSGAPGVYRVDIQTQAGGRIFSGTAELGIELGLQFKGESFDMKDCVSVAR